MHAALHAAFLSARPAPASHFAMQSRPTICEGAGARTGVIQKNACTPALLLTTLTWSPVRSPHTNKLQRRCCCGVRGREKCDTARCKYLQFLVLLNGGGLSSEALGSHHLVQFVRRHLQWREKEGNEGGGRTAFRDMQMQAT